MQAPILPHMGWNTVAAPRQSRLFGGLDPDTRFYFVHSYAARPASLGESSAVVTLAEHGEPFVAAVENGDRSARPSSILRSQAMPGRGVADVTGWIAVSRRAPKPAAREAEAAARAAWPSSASAKRLFARAAKRGPVSGGACGCGSAGRQTERMKKARVLVIAAVVILGLAYVFTRSLRVVVGVALIEVIAGSCSHQAVL